MDITAVAQLLQQPFLFLVQFVLFQYLHVILPPVEQPAVLYLLLVGQLVVFLNVGLQLCKMSVPGLFSFCF